MTDLGAHIGEVARHLYGEPNKRLSSKDELRFGSNGSLSVDLKNGRWFDHEEAVGGNVIELIRRKTGLKNGGVGAWLRDNLGLEEKARPNGAAPAETGRKEIEATYDYTDEAGELLFQAVRYRLLDAHGAPLVKDGKPRKAFSQRRPDGMDGWVWSLKNTRLVPYRFPELQEALALERPIFIPEGEKKVDRLLELGCNATCGPMGAGKWPDDFAPIFAGASVIVLPDNDEPGRGHADLIGAALTGVAASVKLLVLPDLPPKGDIVDWLDAGHGVGELNALVERAPTWGVKPPALHFGAVWFRDAEALLSEPAWLVHDMFTAGDKSLVYGPSQSGKSFFATHVGLSIARGESIFDRRVRRGGVVYIAAEGKKGFKKRLKAYTKAFELEANAELPFLLVPAAVDLYTTGGDIKPLIDDLRRITPAMNAMGVGVDLIVLDTLAAVSPGANENASEDMSRILRHCEQIQEVTNGHVMIVHHKNAAGDRPRGHTSLYAAVDNAVEVMCDDFKNRTAKIAKLKDAEDGASIGFRLQPVTIGSDDDGKPITSCVVVPAHAGMTRTSDKGPKIRDQEAIALQALRYALAEYGEPPPGTMQLPYGTRVVRIGRWKERFLKTAFNEEPTDAAFRQAVKRAVDSLQRRNIVAREQPYMWIVREPSQ